MRRGVAAAATAPLAPPPPPGSPLRRSFGCRAEAHHPAYCVEVSAWAKKQTDDGGNAKWLLANTKPCPKCNKAIEKNQGEAEPRPRERGGCAAYERDPSVVAAPPPPLPLPP